MNETPGPGWAANRGYELGWSDSVAAEFRLAILAEAAAVGEGFCPNCWVRLAVLDRPGWGRCPQCRAGWSTSGQGDSTVVDCEWSADSAL